MDLEIQDFIYKCYKLCSRGDMQMEKKGAPLPPSLAYLAVGEAFRRSGRKENTKKIASTHLVGTALGRASTH